MKEDFVVVTDHKNMITYIDSLQKRNAEQLSFYPKQVFEREKENGRLFLGLLNGEPCGYIYIGAGGGDVKCHQVCIQYDARRRMYGSMLVICMEDYANKHNSFSIMLRCGFDLEANDFWSAHGYKCIAVQDGGVRRKRKINIWKKELMPSLFEDIEVSPAKGKTDSSLWRKHKKTGIITQFNRGRTLSKYRAILEAYDDDE